MCEKSAESEAPEARRHEEDGPVSGLLRRGTKMRSHCTADNKKARRRGTPGRRSLAGALATLAILAAAPAAFAEPEWRVDPLANTTAAPGESHLYAVQLTNTGDTPADGTVTPMTFTGTFPAGLSVISVTNVSGNAWDCSSVVVGASSFACSNNADALPATVSSTFAVQLAVDPSASGMLTSMFEVVGGDPSNPSASAVDVTTITPNVPPFGIDAFDGKITADAAGTPFTQAGGHPYDVSIAVDFNSAAHPAPLKGQPWPIEPVRNLFVDLPPGLVGDPTSIALCTLGELANADGLQPRSLCPPSAQIGVTLVHANVANSGTTLGPIPVFNMVPPPDVPARFGFNVAGTVVTLDATVRSATDYGLTVETRNVPQGIAMTGATFTMWGVPADPAHDVQRACPGERAPWDTGPICSTDAPVAAFLRNPTSCPVPGVGLATTVRVDSWVDPGDFKEATFISHLPNGYPYAPQDWGPPQGPTGCESVPFNPRLDATPLTLAAGKPSGFAFDLSLPQSSNPRTIGQSDLKKAVVTLPLGVRVSPSSASGLQGCSPAQIGLDSTADPRCPDGSTLGSLTIETPMLDRLLKGSIYLAGPHDNPFDSLLAVYLVARGPGVIVKLPGKVEADPLTGQLTTSFDDNPQLPFSNLHLEFKAGPRAPLVNPPACGTYTTHAELTSWSGKVVATDSSFTLSHDGAGAPCPPSQFSPGFAAGTESSTGGTSSPLHVRLTRDDDDEELGSVAVDMPSGLTGKIADATLCGDVAAKAGTCPEASKVGSVTVGAGAGSNPFYITNGRAYITDSYKGAPFGLSIVVPAVAGPFDLGNVVVRSSIFVDRHDATLRVVSDPLPRILQGIPLDVRDVRIAIDRPGFFINPTSCAEKRINGVITSTAGKTAAVSDRFQAAECRSLSLKPRMTLAIGSKGRTSRGASVPFSTRLTMPRGGANLRLVRVTLPTTINARLPVINRACTRAQFDAGRCDGARAGTAVARTPLLRDPLRGNVYFVRNGNPLPDLFITLRGQVAFDLIGRVSIPGGKRLRTTFDAVPDVPITSFTLKLVAGRQGPVGAAANLCSRRGRTAKAELDFIGQNGKVRQVDQRMKVRGCGKIGRAKRR
jgi:uncharacterized repeat protein (TIGR01451 family)